MTKQQILKYNSVSEDFHVMDVIAEKLKLVHNLAITYGNVTLNELEELLYDQHSRILQRLMNQFE